MTTEDRAFVAECIAYLETMGYRCTRTRTQRAPRRLAGRKHRDCIDHHSLSGYATPVCVMTGQDADAVLAFARECLSIGASAGDALTAARMRDHGARLAVAA